MRCGSAPEYNACSSSAICRTVRAAVASPHDLRAGTIKPQCALGHQEQGRLLVLEIQANPGSQPGDGVEFRFHGRSERAGTRREAASRVARRQNRARPVAPRGCRTCRAERRARGPALRGFAPAQAVAQRELGVFGSLRQASFEIVESRHEPGIVPAHAVHTQGDELVAEQFREGRCYHLQMRALSTPAAGRLDGISRGRQQFPHRGNGVRVAARWLQRAATTSRCRRAPPIAVVIDDSLPPGRLENAGSSHRARIGGILHRDVALVVVAIERPRLN